MKKLICLLLVLCLLLGMTGCKSKEEREAEKLQAQWQELYDLGVRYLDEGNYEEAILAFTAAIEIDPKQDEPYAMRGDAYRDSGDLDSAIADFALAIGLRDDYAPYYDALVDLYLQNEDREAAAKVLQDAAEKTEDEDQKDRWNALIEELTDDRTLLEGELERRDLLQAQTLQRYYTYEYYESGYVDIRPEPMLMPFGTCASCIYDFDGDGTLELFTAEVVRDEELWLRIYQVKDGIVTCTGAALVNENPGNFTGVLAATDWQKIYLREYQGDWYVFYEHYSPGGLYVDGQCLTILGYRFQNGELVEVLNEYQAGSAWYPDDPYLQAFKDALSGVGLQLEGMEWNSNVPNFGLSTYTDIVLLFSAVQTYSGDRNSEAFRQAYDAQNLAPMEIVIEPNLEAVLPDMGS